MNNVVPIASQPVRCIHGSNYHGSMYALQERGSNYSVREGESALLEKLGLPINPQELTFADAFHVMMYAATSEHVDRDVIYNADTQAILNEKGYAWRSDPALKDVAPETALYLDAYVRAREFSAYVGSGYEHDLSEKRQYQNLLHKIRGGSK